MTPLVSDAPTTARARSDEDAALPFLKMHGLGNDFVVLDGRAAPRALALSAAETRAVADRRSGVGFDQLIVLGPAQSPGADVFMHIRNADGSASGACGNATRCVATLLAGPGETAAIETEAGILRCAVEAGAVSVDMGPAGLRWDEIPLARPMETLHLPIEAGPLVDPVAVNMGNPHMTFFVPEVDAIDLEALAAPLERHPLYPERANVGVAQVIDRAHLRVRVFERGVGVTQACGTGACAAQVAAARRGLTERVATVTLDGGPLTIEWTQAGRVIMTGPTATSFAGTLDPSLLAGAA